MEGPDMKTTALYRFQRWRGDGARSVTRETPPTRALVPIDPRHDLANHSPDGFEWGYGGSGPAQAALAVLADFYEGKHDDLAMLRYQAFKAEVVAQHAEDYWSITGGEIQAWLDRKAAG
jgi:Family of unknown function (DUF6166)